MWATTSFVFLSTFRTCAVVATLAIAIVTRLTATAGAEPKKRSVLVAHVTDGIVIRGDWRAHVGTGTPAVTIVADETTMHSIRIERRATSLTIVSPISFSHSSKPELRVTLARLRGIATSGSVDLTLDDRSDAPLFLDLSGAGSARATGSVPLLRVTTSGSVDADLTGMTATRARVHARQTSRLAIRASGLTIVALDAARVLYRGTTRVAITRRNRASVTSL